MELQTDNILHDRYRIIEKLGEGGMGAVYLAWDLTLETRVAVKTNFNPAPESVTQFISEAHLLAALRHQNLPRVTDYFVMGKEQFLVMDFVPGDDLGKRLKEQGAQPLDIVLRWASQLCSALNYMHHQDPPVTHRDIKPANIKLTANGDAILVDFGIAKVDHVQAHTATGAAGYTPGYAPPEQYGQGRTGPYSDQFSLAATLYALLTHTKPADSIQRVLGKAALIPIKQLNPDVPENIADAILKAMSLQPDSRFESIETFKSALYNPDFHLEDQVRESITATIVPVTAGPTVVASEPWQATVAAPSKPDHRKRNIILGVLGGLLGMCGIAAGLLIWVLPTDLRGLLAANTQVPTLTSTPLATETETVVLEETTPVSVVIEATMTPLPSPTLTLVPTPTSTPESVGGTGVIAFASDAGEDEHVQIWTMRVIRNQRGDVSADLMTQLTFNEGDKDQPVWSPDGSQIAYVAPGAPGNGLDIWVMNADGEGQVNITNYDGDEFDPVWTPDGQGLVFTHHLRDAGSTAIYSLTWINADGTNRQRLSQDFVEWDPTFSPDMNWLLYVISANSHDYLFFRGSYDDFQTPRKFDLRSIFGEFGEVSDPVWAPAGNQFALTRHEGVNENIVLVTYGEIQRNGVHQPQEFVLTETGSDSDSAWSPDARWLAFTSTRDSGDPEIYLMTTTGRPQINLTNRPGVDRSPDWKPILAGGN